MTFKFYSLILTFLLVTFFDANSKELNICSTCEFTTITEAIRQAENGDILRLKSGVYKEGNIIIDKQVEIIGEDWPIVDGEDNTEIFTIEADYVTIRGIQFQNVGTSYIKDRAAIKVESQRHVIIEGNRLRNAFFGIYLVRGIDCVIRNNDIRGNAKDEASSGNAIQLWYSKRVLVENNYCTQHRDGIYIEFSENCEISDNVSIDNIRYGLHFMFSDSNKYYNNRFESNKAGVAVMYSSYIHMENNSFLNNWGSSSYGILLKEIKDSRLNNNLFKGNTVAILSEGTVRLKVENNRIEDNGWAVIIRGNCETNEFTQNNFISNTFELSTESTNDMGNRFYKNYWSEYSGYDLNRDGIGDIPHNPVSLFSYIVENNPTAIILLRSLFLDLLNLAEKITPILTPVTLVDSQPLLEEVK